MKLSTRIALALAAGSIVVVLPLLLGTSTSPNIGASADLSGELARKAVLVPLFLSFIGGLLTALTPCVYPLIPITLAVFGASPNQQNQPKSRFKPATLAATYGSGICIMYTCLGIGAALTGKAFGSALSSPWISAGLAVLFAIFAAAMLGLFDFQLPVSLQTALTSVSKTGYPGAFFMGLVAGIVAAPCTGPILSGILVHVASTQNVVLGALLLFFYALGMSLPYFVIGAFSLRLPRSGKWMEYAKLALGAILLTFAIEHLTNALPYLKTILSLKTVPRGALYSGGLVSTGILLAALLLPQYGSKPIGNVLKVLALMLVAVGLSLRSGAPLGQVAIKANWLHITQENPKNNQNQAASQLSQGAKSDIPAVMDEKSAIELARTSKKPVILDFYADWCNACKRLDQTTFADPLFLEEAKRFVTAKVDGTNEALFLDVLYKKYRVLGLPTIVFIDSEGNVRHNLTVSGYLPASQLTEIMKKVH